MPFLQHIAFSNSVQFKRRIYYFEYGGVRFKLIQNDPRRAADVLLTIVPAHDTNAENHAFAVGAEFVSALSWSIWAPMAVEMGGGIGLPGKPTLRSARCRMFFPPQFVSTGRVRGFDITRIAAIETAEQRRALALFREGHSSNKALLSILLFWQIMDILPKPGPVAWVNSEYAAERVRVTDRDLKLLDLRGRTLGDYFDEDCRHAIAHLRRFPGKRTLLFDDRGDVVRMAASERVLSDFAMSYIRTRLGLSKRMALVRKRTGGFPVYIKEGAIPSTYRLAYP